VRAHLDAYRDERLTFHVDSGEHKVIRLTLEPTAINQRLVLAEKSEPAPVGALEPGQPVDASSAGIWTRWWFWTGVGVVAAAAVGGIVLATQSDTIAKPYQGSAGSGTAP
jgi:hypothetical protein